MNDRISYLGKAREKRHTSNFALLLDWSNTLHLSSARSKDITRIFEPNENKENGKTEQTNPKGNLKKKPLRPTLINGRDFTLKPLIQRSVRRVGAHKSAWYVHQIHDVTFARKPGLTVFGFFTQHHLVPGPVIVSSNQRAAHCNAIS